MCEDSDQEVSELDIEGRTWRKLERNLKSFGFREGAAQGRETALQEGFNKGYSDGLHVGKHIGFLRGIESTYRELGIPVKESHLKEEDITNIAKQICVLCENKNQEPILSETVPENFENILVKQQKKIDEALSILQNLELSSIEKK